MNNKGQINSLMVMLLLLFVVIIGGFFIVVGSGILTFVGDEINDVTSSLGVQGDTNLSHASDVSVGVVNTGIQTLKFVSGIFLVFALLGILIFAGTIRASPNGFMIAFYIMAVLLLVISAMYMSNIYEEFLDGTDEIADELKGFTMASFILLYLPHIITVISFIGGFIIFSGIGEEFT